MGVVVEAKGDKPRQSKESNTFAFKIQE